MDEKQLFDPAKMDGGPRQGELVYHFTSYHVASSFILGGDRQFLVNTVKKMNDPMEHQVKHLLGSSTVDLDHTDARQIHEALAKASSDNARILCCSLDTPADTIDHPNGRITRKPGRRGFDHPSMWTHYGENHSGVCLIFYRNALDQAVTRSSSGLTVKSGAVQYDPWAAMSIIKNKSTAGPAQISPTHDDLRRWAASEIEQRYRELFLIKHDDWAPEAEYRWLILGSFDGDLFVKLSGNELAGVVIGSDFPLLLHQPLSAVCEEWSVPVRAMMWTNGEANHPWPLSKDDDPAHIREFWEHREMDARIRRIKRCKTCGHLLIT